MKPNTEKEDICAGGAAQVEDAKRQKRKGKGQKPRSDFERFVLEHMSDEARENELIQEKIDAYLNEAEE